MIELAVKDLAKHYGAIKIFENISFDIKTKDRAALIGRNGTGKTTLMKLLMNKETYQNGSIFIRKGATLGYLDQIPDYPEHMSAIDVMMEAFLELTEMQFKLTELEEKLARGEELEKYMKIYGDLQHQFEVKGGYSIQEKISKICEGLKISSEMRQKSFNILSGGEKSRIILGKILLENPDILLLDEPSNHLDLSSIEWLESFLSDYDGTVLMISHDRYFLERFATKIIELEEDKASEYEGNYEFYIKERDRRFEEAMNFYNAQQRKIKKMEEQIKRYRIWGAMRDSDKMYVRAKELEKRLSKVEKIDRPNNESKKIKLNFAGARSGREVLDIKNLSKSFKSQNLFKNLNLKVYYQDQIGIMGDNGTGKSTLLKIIMKEIEADSGEFKLGSKVEIGYLPQEVYFDNEEQSILDFFYRYFNITMSQARNILAGALFTEDDVFKKIKNLSGGEKSRLKLAVLMEEKVNFLILDEPTNHLDLDSREMLENSLTGFNGTIAFVSHDRYFINKMATSLAEIENKKLTSYIGSYEYYKLEKAKRAAKAIVKEEVVLKSDSINKLNYEEQKEIERQDRKKKKRIEKIELEIEKLEKQKLIIASEMEENSTNAGKLNELVGNQELCDEEIMNLMEEWESLTD